MTSADEARGGQTVYRTTQQSKVFGVGAVIIVASFLGATVPLFTDDDTRWSIAIPLIAVMVILAVAFGWFGWRQARARVSAGADGVEVVNPLRSYRYRWDEIERFSVEPYAWGSIGRLHLRDGTSVDTFGIGGRNRALFKGDRWAEDPIDALNRLLDQHRPAERWTEA